ncbi:MAG: 5-bromo-4-chloroindolyl phosphate hydrolysis family protein [Faecousia sp.]
MASYNQDWDDLGRSIQDIVDRAVNSRDYQRLNQTVCQVVGKAIDMGSEAVRKAVDASSRPTSPGAKTVYREARPAAVPEKKLPVLYGGTGGETAVGLVKIIGGGLTLCVAFVALLSSLILLIAGAGLTAIPAVLTAGGFAAGIWLVVSGIRTLGWVSRFKTYRKTLGQNTHCTLERLARSVGKSVKYVRRELRQMIDKGLFLEGHLDKEETCLITSHETYQHYEQSRLALEQRQRQEAAASSQKAPVSRDPQLQEVLDRGNAFIAQIRRCNDAIPGEEISGKISRMESIVRRIFERAEAHPEILPDLKKLMDYYLPMTIKLLNAYADMDAQGIQGDTIEASKREIEATLDTLNLAFEKLLDDLFRDTAMDVSSDISVLNTLLAQEGLAEDDLSKMKKQQTL